MGNNPEVLVLVIVGAILFILFNFLIFSIKFSTKKREAKEQEDTGPKEGRAGDPQTCPVCSAKLKEGQLVRSAAFPAAKGSSDRLMHIRGCTHCITGKRDRVCPVCQTSLALEEHLISRLFERAIKRSHVHIIGCSRCKGPPSARP